MRSGVVYFRFVAAMFIAFGVIGLTLIDPQQLFRLDTANLG